MKRDHRVGLLASGEDWIPITREDTGQSDPVWPFGESQGSETPPRVAPNLRRRLFWIGEVGDSQRDDSVGVRLPPALVYPIVECLGHRQSQLSVCSCRVDPTTEAGDHGWKVE